MLLELADFDKLRDSALQTFSDRVASVAPETGWELNVEVARLESQLTQLFTFAAIAAKREETLEATAEIWGVMVSVCDAFAAKITGRCEQHPACMAAHDRILDVRNKCARLQRLHA